MNDDELARFYENPENRRGIGPGRRQINVGIRLSDGTLVSVPRRFLGGQPATVNRMKNRITVEWSR